MDTMKLRRFKEEIQRVQSEFQLELIVINDQLYVTENFETASTENSELFDDIDA